MRHVLTLVLSLLAILAKPIAVIIPPLIVAYEFCSNPHVPITQWRWRERNRFDVLTRTIALSAAFVIVGFSSSFLFERLLSLDPKHGGWLILVVSSVLVVMLAVPPSRSDLLYFKTENTSGIRILMPPFVLLSLLYGAGSAWTIWAQKQVGAIKGGLTFLPTVNLTFDAMLAYARMAFVPTGMSVSHTWSEYPYLSAKGLIGGLLIAAVLCTAVKLAGSDDRHQRLVSFGILWYLIALVPVSNIVPTSTKMADRYLFVPTVGSTLVLAAVGVLWTSKSRVKQIALCGALLVMFGVYVGWSYKRTEIWAGKTVLYGGQPQPDLSLWTSAVETNPDDTNALRSRALACLHLSPPDTEKAIADLEHALQLSETNQTKIAGGRELILTPLYEALGDAYFTQASQVDGVTGSAGWRRKKEAYSQSKKYFDLASVSPSGFASSDARVLDRLAEASEALAISDAQEITTAAGGQQLALIRDRENLRSSGQEALQRAQAVLIAGNVSKADVNYRMVVLDEGNLIFNRELGASSNEEKEQLYLEALLHYQEAEQLLPDDPRPFLYEGLCHERLTDVVSSPDEKQRNFILAERALHKATALGPGVQGYSPAEPYRALASLYAHVNDFHSVLASLKKAKQLDPQITNVDAEIESVERYLTSKKE